MADEYQRDRRSPDPWRIEVDRRLAAQERATAEILVIVKRLDKDHIVTTAAAEAREKLISEWRHRGTDIAKAIGAMGAVLGMVAAVAAFFGAK